MSLEDSACDLDLRALASVLARGCRELRDAVVALPGARRAELAGAWKGSGAPVEAERFADDYAQTVTHALLAARVDAEALARSGGPLALALAALRAHGAGLAGPVERLERAVARVDPGALRREAEDPWLSYYEDFLAAYDPRRRSALGAYYTPAEVVRAQIEVVRDVLGREFGKPLGFLDPEVLTVDPACGTGTYVQAIVTDALSRAEAGEAAAAATHLAENVVALEIMAGPQAVAQMRLSELLLRAGARLPSGGVQVRWADTLAAPGDPLAGPERVVVCIGNPPYERQALGPAEVDRSARRGGWVRHGEEGAPGIVADFVPPAGSEAGRHAKNVYNDYVYFWRWALWQVFERAGGRGIVCFVTASSFLRGPGFAAMRRHMREVLDELWIIDVGGDSLGPRRSANVFAIKTPVCIAVALRRGGARPAEPARVWYSRLPDALGRADKLALLGRLRSSGDLAWQRGPEGWEAPFVPGAAGDYSRWPRLDALCPWHHSGAQWKRTWPVGETKELVERRWQALLAAEDRRALFHESEAWTVGREGRELLDEALRLPPIGSLPRTAPAPRIVRYGWRALDRQWCLADGRLGDRLRPVLWQIAGERQIYLTTLMSSGLSRGPALVACAHVPDLHHFRGSYGDRGVVPLWRDAAGTEPNVTAGLLEMLSSRYGAAVSAEELFAYIHGCLGCPAYTEALAEELAEPGPRVPLTAEAGRFSRMAGLGRRLLRLHTYGERSQGGDGGPIEGAARCVQGIAAEDYPESFAYAGGELRVGGGVFAPMSPEVWSYEVSGLRVLASWLGFRMQRPRGRKSSPLDAIRPERWTEAMTRELLELLWVLEGSLAIHREQGRLLAEIVAGPLISGAELPSPGPGQASPPRPRPGRDQGAWSGQGASA